MGPSAVTPALDRAFARFAAISLSFTMGCAARAQWTIRCIEFSGPARTMQAEQVAETLRRTPGVRADEVRLIDDAADRTGVYYGTYERSTDPKTGLRRTPHKLTTDLEFIRQLGNDSGKRFFLRAMPVREPTPNVGNPDWDLRQVDSVYTLQVAAFEPTDTFSEYKRAAAAYCELLRKKGYEAYYCHSDASSVVTVGTFDEDAVVTRADGRTYYSDEVRTLQANELLKYHLLNGVMYRAVGPEGRSERIQSVLVKVPKNDGSMP